MVLATGAACVALLVACTGGDEQPGTAETTPGAGIVAEPSPPHLAGRAPVTLQPALAYVGKADACPPDPGPPVRVCDPEGQAFRPVGTARSATLTEVSTELDSGHTAWAVTVRFARRSRTNVADASTQARETGGVVLVFNGGGTVVLAAGPADIDEDRIVVGSLDKPTAWSLVRALGGS
jgi:hypothetical protein